WTSDNKIVFGGVGGLRQVPSAGGAATPVTASDTSDGAVADAFPSLLPDGRHFVYTHQENGPGNGGIYLGSLDAKPEEQRKKRLLADVSHAVFAPGDAGGSIDGYLLFLRGVSVGALVNGAATGPPKLAGTLMAQPFDAGELALVGDAVPVAEQVQLLGFSASTNNVLVYRAGDPFGQIVAAAQNLQLTWFDRQGKPSGTAGEPGLYSESVLSPDGKQLALSRFDLQSLTGDLYVLDFARGGSRHLTFDPGSESSPVWSPDSSHLAFRSGPTGNPTGPTDLYQKASNGTGEQELLFKSDASKTPTSWSRDSRFLMFTSIDPKTKSDLWALPMAASGKDARKPVLFLSTAFNETQG
ncbi:MAG: TolB family protein, partial [Bryobacteraceae bacterium]